jgi:hypothetical protein
VSDPARRSFKNSRERILILIFRLLLRKLRKSGARNGHHMRERIDIDIVREWVSNQRFECELWED